MMTATWGFRKHARPPRRALPFGGPIGRVANACDTEYGQFYGGGDVIFQF